MDEPRRSLARALESFANAVLERTLPRIRQWLAARLGPRAELAGLEVDGARVHLVGARVPLGPRAILHASRATFVTRPEDLALGLPPISLERLEGTLELDGARGPSARVSLEGAPARASDEWIAGSLELRDLELAGHPFEGAASVWLTSTRFGVDDARFSSGGASLRIDAGGTFESGELRITELRASSIEMPVLAFVEAIAALAGSEIVRLPIADARVNGEVELRGGALRAALRASAGAEERAALEIDGRIELGALRGSLRGHVAPSLLALLPITIDGPPLALEATLAGTPSRPRVEGTARTAELAIRAGDGEPLRISRVRADAAFDAGLTLRARARAGAGSVSLSIDRGVTDVRVERADLAPVLSLLPTRVGSFARAIGVESGQAWLVARVTGDLVEGALHVESPRASVTLEPMRADRRRRAIERSTLRGRLAPRGLGVEGPIDLELAIDHASELEVRAEGTIASSALRVTIGEREPAELGDVRARVRVAGREALLTDARARAFDGRLRGGAVLSWDGPIRASVTELALESLREPLARWLFSRTPESRLVWRDLLPGLVVSGELARTDGALRGELRAETALSRAAMQTSIADDGALEGALEAHLAIADLAPLFASWPMIPAHGAVWRLEGTCGGSLSAPRFELDARCDRQPVIALAQVELVASDVHARVSVTRDRLVWSELALRGYGGALRSRGSVAFSGAASARLEVDDVRAEALPLVSGRAVGEHLAGALSGALDLWRSRGITIGCGRLRVADPEYPLLARGAALATKLSLALPSLRGDAPLTASVRLGARGWRFSELSARVPELEVRGAIDVVHGGALEGRVRVRPEPRWLSASTFLSPLGVLLEELPVRVSGSLGAPRLEADAWDAADGALARSSFGRRVRSILSELAPTVGRPSRAGGSGRRPASLLTTDAILDRLARDPEDADELFEVLIERGMRADEIARGVAKRR